MLRFQTEAEQKYEEYERWLSTIKQVYACQTICLEICWGLIMKSPWLNRNTEGYNIKWQGT